MCEHYPGKEMQAFNGECMVVIQSGEKMGNVRLTASAAGLSNANLALNVVP